MRQPADLASHVLRLELQLEAYQKLHTEELLVLREALNECKRAIAALYDEPTPTVSRSATYLEDNVSDGTNTRVRNANK